MKKYPYHKRGRRIQGYWARKHPLYSTWSGMFKRCYNVNEVAFKNYGARGIKVCERWFSFENFAIDMGLRPSRDLRLERIDNDGNYQPSNCKWATASEQCHNRRKFISNTTGYRGILKCGKFYQPRFQWKYYRYELKRFRKKKEAAAHLAVFVKKFFINRKSALAMIPKETLWLTSSSGVRGVTRHIDGGYIVRVTISKQRHYVGYYKTRKEAIDARDRFLKSRAC